MSQLRQENESENENENNKKEAFLLQFARLSDQQVTACEAHRLRLLLSCPERQARGAPLFEPPDWKPAARAAGAGAGAAGEGRAWGWNLNWRKGVAVGVCGLYAAVGLWGGGGRGAARSGAGRAVVGLNVAAGGAAWLGWERVREIIK